MIKIYEIFKNKKKTNLKGKLFVSVKDISHLNEGCFSFLPSKSEEAGYFPHLPCQLVTAS